MRRLSMDQLKKVLLDIRKSTERALETTDQDEVG